MHCPKFFLHILTEPDNKTFCPIRVVAIMGCMTFFGLAIANYVQHAIFDPLGFASGVGGLVAGTGAALKLKDGTGASGPPEAPSNQ